MQLGHRLTDADPAAAPVRAAMATERRAVPVTPEPAPAPPPIVPSESRSDESRDRAPVAPVSPVPTVAPPPGDFSPASWAFAGVPDAPRLDPVRTGKVTRVKFNRGGSSLSLRLEFDNGAKAAFKPQRLFKMARSKAYLFGGVEIRWKCDPALLKGIDDVPAEDTFHFPGGLKDYLAAAIHADTLVHPDIFSGRSGKVGGHGGCEWAVVPRLAPVGARAVASARTSQWAQALVRFDD